MLSIHPEVQDLGDEDEKNYETDEMNKENMNEFCIFITDQYPKIQNIQQNVTRKPCASFVERRTRRGK